jgi:uncharacterized protein (TIGR00730 family)
MIQKVSLFAGNNCANPELNGAYLELAHTMGKLLGQSKITLITGAGGGLMEAAAQGAFEAGGKVSGFGLNLENAKQSKFIQAYERYDKLGPRQEKLISEGEAYLALPGGIGTFHEIFHILALKRLKEIPNRPLIFVGEYFLPLNQILEAVVPQGFADNTLKSLYKFVRTPQEALEEILRQP